MTGHQSGGPDDIVISTYDGERWAPLQPQPLLADFLALVADHGGTIEIRFPPKGDT